MNDLRNLSTDELESELRRRKIVSLVEVNNLMPKPLENPDLSSLRKLCEEWVSDSIEGKFMDDDYDNWFFETAMKTIMGNDVFEKVRKIQKLKI